MKIYRVEDSDGAGPFSNNLACRLIGKYYEFDTHPDPYFDHIKIRKNGKDQLFGCTTLDKLKYWFIPNKESEDIIREHCREVLVLLQSSGFMVNVFDIDAKKCQYGRSFKQVAFAVEDSVLIESYPIDILFENIIGG